MTGHEKDDSKCLIFLLGSVSFSFIEALRVEIGLIVGISVSLNTPLN